MVSCSTNHPNSEIEVIKLDKELVKQIQSDKDSTYIENPKRSDFWTIEHYFKDSIESKIMKDSTGNIIGISKFQNGQRIFAQEYYPNGQLVGKTDFPPGIIEGHATYYHFNGRIKSTGQWKNFKQVGEWKNYNQDGELETIEYFDERGSILETEKIK